MGAQRVSLPPSAAFVAREIERPTAAIMASNLGVALQLENDVSTDLRKYPVAIARSGAGVTQLAHHLLDNQLLNGR